MLSYEYSETEKCYNVFINGKYKEQVLCSDVYRMIVSTSITKKISGENKVDFHTDYDQNIKAYKISNNNMEYVIGVPLTAKDEIAKIDIAIEEMKKKQYKIKKVNKSKLKKSVKLAGFVLVTVPLGPLAYQNIANPEPDFSIPPEAEGVYENVSNSMESDNLDPENLAARDVAAQQLYSTDPIEERHYKLDMDDVAVEITQAKNDYNEGKLSKKEAREILSEIRDFYKESSEIYDEYKAEQNNSKSL